MSGPWKGSSRAGLRGARGRARGRPALGTVLRERRRPASPERRPRRRARRAEPPAQRGSAAGHLARAPPLAVAAERKLREKTSDRVENRRTGPEMPGSQSRETGVVAREEALRAKATRSVLDVSSHGLPREGGSSSRSRRMGELRVLLFLNVPAPGGSDFDPDAVARDYFREFLKKNWPSGRSPGLYWNPRSLAAKGDERAVIHAKCVVVDGHTALVTSANFTEAAHARNIEAGALSSTTPDSPARSRGSSRRSWRRGCCGGSTSEPIRRCRQGGFFVARQLQLL